MSKFGLTQVIWGNGKGKTTSAVGQGIRAAGHGYKVHMIQFMKGVLKGCPEFKEYGEIEAIEKLTNFTVERFGVNEWFTGENKGEHRKAALEGVEAAKKALSTGYDVVILDEILYAINMDILKSEEVVDLIKSKNEKAELILTGGHEPVKELIDLADYVSEIKKGKHPFDKGVKAREGIEF